MGNKVICVYTLKPNLTENFVEDTYNNVITINTSEELQQYPHLSSEEEELFFTYEKPYAGTIRSIVNGAIRDRKNQLQIEYSEMYHAMSYGYFFSNLFKEATVQDPSVNFTITDNPGEEGSIDTSDMDLNRPASVRIFVKSAHDLSDVKNETGNALPITDLHVE